MDTVLDYSERMMRAALARLPDGEAEFADRLLSAMRHEFGGHAERTGAK